MTLTFPFHFEPGVQQSIVKLSRIVLLCSFMLPGGISAAFANQEPFNSEQKTLLREIAESQYWRKLVHYKTNLIFDGYESDITDPAFFLSENGRENPYQELVVSVAAFKQDPSTICRFPARYHWLSTKYEKQLDLETGKLANCSELQEWKATINPGSATLIFPAAYLNGPSSMFGHTLLRIEPADERANLPLITYAVNYAANVRESDNDVAFAFKGILGGYPGIMAIVPYHEKIKEYGEIENRDIWEYELNLNKSEITQMLRHAWELKDLRSAYYFFDLNCSYLILNLIETAREDINLTDYFRYKVIPIDTVRVVVDAGLVSDTKYRAAAATQLAQRYETLKPDQREQVKNILDDQPDLSHVEKKIQSREDYARILEVVYDAYRYQAFQTPGERDQNAEYNLALLNARSQQEVKNIWPDIVIPQVKPEQGHKSGRLAVGYERNTIKNESQDKLLLKVRPAYHDLLDPAQGFPVGAQINFLDFIFAYNMDSDEVDVDQVTIIDILSLTPSHDLFDPVSWRVDFGYERRNLYNANINVLQVSPGFGKTSYVINDILAYGLLNASLEYSPDYTDEYAIGTGLQAGILSTHDKYSGLLELKSGRYFSGQTDTRFSVNAGIARHIYTNMSLRLSAERKKLYSQYVNIYQFNVNWYF